MSLTIVPNKGYELGHAYDDPGPAGRGGHLRQTGMTWAVANGVITGGDAGLNPQGNITRAELATMLMRFCGNVLK